MAKKPFTFKTRKEEVMQKPRPRVTRTPKADVLLEMYEESSEAWERGNESARRACETCHATDGHTTYVFIGITEPTNRTPVCTITTKADASVAFKMMKEELAARLPLPVELYEWNLYCYCWSSRDDQKKSSQHRVPLATLLPSS